MTYMDRKKLLSNLYKPVIQGKTMKLPIDKYWEIMFTRIYEFDHYWSGEGFEEEYDLMQELKIRKYYEDQYFIIEQIK